MRFKKNEFSLEEALNLWIEKNQSKFKVSPNDIYQNWRFIVGDLIANQTTSICISNQILQIKVSHSLWKKELFYHTDTIKQKINQFAQQELITKVVIL